MDINLLQIERDQLFLAMLYERNGAILNLEKQVKLLTEEIAVLRNKLKDNTVT